MILTAKSKMCPRGLSKVFLVRRRSVKLKSGLTFDVYSQSSNPKLLSARSSRQSPSFLANKLIPRDKGVLTAVSDIMKCIPPKSVMDEGGIEPTIECRKLARTVLGIIVDAGLSVPVRVGASRYGGLMLVCKLRQKTIEIEVDNEQDISAVVDDGCKVEDSQVFSVLSEFHRFVRRISNPEFYALELQR